MAESRNIFSCKRLIEPLFQCLCYIFLFFVSAITFSACHTVKYVPDGKYLLDRTHLKVDNDQIDKNDLKGYLRQRENSMIFGFWKLQMDLYNVSGRDSTKWINMAFKAMGEPPEILDTLLTDFSVQQLTQTLHNKGWFDAQVNSQIVSKAPKKADVTYNIVAGEPYLLRNYSVRLDSGELYNYAVWPRRPIQRGMLFDADVFNSERERIANAMRHNGYYFFDKDLLYYDADSIGLNHQIDAILRMRDFPVKAPDSVRQIVFTKFTIRNIIFELDPATDNLAIEGNNHNAVYDTLYNDEGYVFINEHGKAFLRPNVLIRNCHIVPGTLYNDRMVDYTYSSLNALSSVKYVDIKFSKVGRDELDCHISITKSKSHTLSAEVEGTYSAGDWGVAGQLGYGHKNLFHGAEELNLTGRGAYEWRQAGGTAIEWNVKASLMFPNLPIFVNKDANRRVNTKTSFSVQYNYQTRPDEYTRTIVGTTVKNTWTPFNGRWNHSFSFFDLSYVYLPWISEEFRDRFLVSSNILKYSYEDHFILDWNYSGAFSSYRSYQPLRSYVTFNYSIETAGNFLYGISAAARLPRSGEDNSYKIFNIRFSQYAKGDLSFSYNQIINANHRLVYHAGLGVAYPYGNSQSIPFEKRYFSGGANSVRGWQARALGPGTYRNTSSNVIDFNNQAGDIKLDLNVEYRFKVIWRLDGALFVDAGNIWTIRDYNTQPGGVFKFNEFYKQIALSYGLGVRIDFSVFVFRVDCGIKLYDPSRIADGTQWRQPNWKDDVTFHFAIGYPF